LVEGEWDGAVALDACDRLLTLLLDRVAGTGEATSVG